MTTRWPLVLAVFLSGCATTWDPHAPSTIVARESGGPVTVKHGQRLRIDLPKVGDYAWTREEPQIPVVVPQGPPNADAWMFTPVRSGTEKLRFAMAQRTVEYEVTVPDEGTSLAAWIKSVFRPASRASNPSR
jgi:hypothetical protein